MQFKIIYIDDEVELCESFAEVFSSEGVQITTFTDPKAATEYANKITPDLVFIDNRLPSTSGEKVARLMNASIPKILVTGNMTDALSDAFVRVLPKPYPIKEVIQLINDY